jgi:hypothetical protein
MKSYDAATGIVILILVAVGLTNFSMYKEEVRPIKLQILDEVTGEPVRNTIVYYRVQTARIKNILGLPLIDPVYYRNVVEERYYTDEQGCLNLPRRKVYLKLYEHVGREHIYVNLELIKKTEKMEDFFKATIEKNYNPIGYLKGVIIYSSKYDIHPTDYRPTVEADIFERVLNEKSLLKNSDELIIRLRRHEKSD